MKGKRRPSFGDDDKSNAMMQMLSTLRLDTTIQPIDHVINNNQFNKTTTTTTTTSNPFATVITNNLFTNTTSNPFASEQFQQRPNDQDVLKLVRLLLAATTILYIQRLVNSNRTAYFTFEKVSLFFSSVYASSINDRISIFEDQDNHQNNAFGLWVSIIDTVLFALSKIKQQCYSESLIFETLDAIWRLHYKENRVIIKTEQIHIFLSIFKHYQFKDNQLQLQQDITNLIYNNLPPRSPILKTKEFQLFFKQTIGILLLNAYDDDYFIPQRFEQDYDQFMIDWNKENYKPTCQQPKSRFMFLQSISLEYRTLFNLVLDYFKVILKETASTTTSWKDKLVFLGLLNYMASSGHQHGNPFLSLLSDPVLQIMISGLNQDNVLVHLELFKFLFKFDYTVIYGSMFRLIVNDVWKGIVKRKEESVQPRILFTLCTFIKDTGDLSFYLDVTDEIFERSLQSDTYVAQYAKTLIIEQPHIAGPRLLPSILSFLDHSDGEYRTDMVFQYFGRHKSTIFNNRKYLKIIMTRLLLVQLDIQAIDLFIYNLFDWIFLSESFATNLVIYLPFILKRILDRPTTDEKRLVKFCEKLPPNFLYPYINHQQQTTTNQYFQQLLDLFTISHGEIQPELVKSLIEHAQLTGISISIEQKTQIMDWIKNGIFIVHDQIKNLDPNSNLPGTQLDKLRQYSEFIHQIASLDQDNDCNQYLEIGIYHVEQMLESIRRVALFVNDKECTLSLVASAFFFYELFKTIDFSCQAKNIWSSHFNKYLRDNIKNDDHYQSLLFLTKLNQPY
ncbi:hypothetical protein DFA_10397 [Cavenderia fasciculata]|uniref:Uncharacterized protein n=1 Tax=Cavenderia fasciculata TaxID=261658 RepID=F4QA36_CACFS|nr:uncharacterized protein DFA_10397 [Cavenderia fasciculata]EGG15555.1 hypothetical protein DFA_10397 [Cavenderia fasciculata]|eukprot:XP_004354297.1 hypothetical protein DFA_10397 [Cavenderia fasciculata]